MIMQTGTGRMQTGCVPVNIAFASRPGGLPAGRKPLPAAGLSVERDLDTPRPELPDLERAFVNPAAVFHSPRMVLRHPRLMAGCKREILEALGLGRVPEGGCCLRGHVPRENRHGSTKSKPLSSGWTRCGGQSRVHRLLQRPIPLLQRGDARRIIEPDHGRLTLGQTVDNLAGQPDLAHQPCACPLPCGNSGSFFGIPDNPRHWTVVRMP